MSCRITAALLAVLGLGASLASPAPAAAAQVLLDVPEIIQEHDQWCWAGATRAALLHFGVDAPQCSIAEYTRTHTNAVDVDLGNTDCCVDWNQGCNTWNYFWYYGGSIADILGHFGSLQNLTYERPLSLDDVTNALDAQRLVFARWVWSSGGGHFVVAHGYDGSAVYYMNPWPGEGAKIAEYAWLYSGDAHTWATSLTTGRPATTCGTEGGVCDDGDACTRNDTCRSGLCVGEPVTCTAAACQKSACDPQTGQCPAPSYLPDGTACDDGDPCTDDDACLYGACQGTARECDGVATECRSHEICRPSTGTCVSTPVADDTPCTGGTCQGGECFVPPVGDGPSCSSAGAGLGSLSSAAALALWALLRRRPRRR